MPASLLPPPAPPRATPAAPSFPPRRIPLRRDYRSGLRPAASRRSLALSLVLHAGAVVLFVWLVPGRPPVAPTEGGPETVRYVDLGDWPGGAAAGEPGALSAPAPAVGDPTPAAPSAAPALPAPLAPLAVPGRAAPRLPAGGGAGRRTTPGGAGAGGEGGARTGAGTGAEGTAGGGLQGGWRDPRLIPTPRQLPPPTEHERYMAGLAERIGAFNDSVAGEAERARRSTDWTRTDSNGRRWGASPGKIHLGGVTLPGPAFTPPPGQRDEIEKRAKQRAEIDRQADDAQRRRALEEQRRSARERGDRARGGGEG